VSPASAPPFGEWWGDSGILGISIMFLDPERKISHLKKIVKFEHNAKSIFRRNPEG
jgi:hypothetical protein